MVNEPSVFQPSKFYCSLDDTFLKFCRCKFYCLLFGTLNAYNFFYIGKRACVGYEDGSLRLWDLKGGTVQQTVSGKV